MPSASALYERIRDRLDIDGLSFADDTELGHICAEAYFVLWDVMIASWKDEMYWDRQTLTTVANQDYVDIDIATGGTFGVYRFLRLEFKGTGQSYRPVFRLNFAAEEIDDTPRTWTSPRSFKYFTRRGLRAVTNDTTAQAHPWRVYFSPPPNAVHSLRLYYIPPPTIVIDNSGVYQTFPDDFPEFVIAYVCEQVANKNERDPSGHAATQAKWKTIIENYATPTQMQESRTVADFRAQNDHEDFDFLERRR